MANSMFASLLNTLDSRTVGEVAHAIGQPEQSVSRGMESCIAALMSGLANKAGDPGALKSVLDIVPSSAGPVSWSQVTSGLADPNSSLMATGKRLLPALFGGSENVITSGITRASGLSGGAISTLLTMAGPVVMSFIARRVRDGGMTMNSLGSLLQRETGTFRNALPAGLSEHFWPGGRTVETASPVIAQAVTRENSSNWLLPALAATALALGLIWLFSHAHRPPVPRASISVPRGEASRLANPVPATTTCTLPASVILPAGGVEARILSFAQNPDAKPSATTWFNTDQLNFKTGSTTLKPGSSVQIDNIAAILTNCPTVRMTVAGYTDNVGSVASNLRLSRDRADTVVSQLVNKGVSRDRLTAEGYGEEYPVADNATAEGRAENRRVAMRVTEK
jgi:outer membrane protein OmpA-like peptidoglycan-associated protein